MYFRALPGGDTGNRVGGGATAARGVAVAQGRKKLSEN